MAQVISGNFKPRRQRQDLPIQRVMLLIAGLFGVLLLTTLVLYGVSVQVEDHLRQLSFKTRQLNETNHDLQIKLNRTQSYRNIEEVSANTPQLQPAQETLTIRRQAKKVSIAKEPTSIHYPIISGY